MHWKIFFFNCIMCMEIARFNRIHKNVKDFFAIKADSLKMLNFKYIKKNNKMYSPNT